MTELEKEFSVKGFANEMRRIERNNDTETAHSLADELMCKLPRHMELLRSVGDMKGYFDISNVLIGMVSCRRVLENAPTIIEADKAEKQEVEVND